MIRKLGVYVGVCLVHVHLCVFVVHEHIYLCLCDWYECTYWGLCISVCVCVLMGPYSASSCYWGRCVANRQEWWLVSQLRGERFSLRWASYWWAGLKLFMSIAEDALFFFCWFCAVGGFVRKKFKNWSHRGRRLLKKKKPIGHLWNCVLSLIVTFNYQAVSCGYSRKSGDKSKSGLECMQM